MPPRPGRPQNRKEDTDQLETVRLADRPKRTNQSRAVAMTILGQPRLAASWAQRHGQPGRTRDDSRVDRCRVTRNGRSGAAGRMDRTTRSEEAFDTNEVRNAHRMAEIFCPARPTRVYTEGAPWAPRTRYRPVGRHHTLSHPLTTPFPHSQRPTNAGRSAAAKDTIYPNRLSPLSPVGPGAPATGSVKSPTTAVPAASGGTVA